MSGADAGRTGSTDVIVVGAGLAGLVAACEVLDAGKRVTILEQEPASNLGGQAWWSFGGLFLVDSPEQRRLGVRDSLALARADWAATAGFDRPEDEWGRRWADAYLEFAAGEKRAWLRARGIRLFPVVGWAERGDATSGRGNSVPRFHIVWGTGPGLLAPFVRQVRDAVADGRAVLRFRHRVDTLVSEGGAVTGVTGTLLAPDDALRGAPSNRDAVGGFELAAGGVLVTSGGIGGDHELVRSFWPQRMGPQPAEMLSGVPAHVDGRMLAITAAAGARLVNGDRMWHYVEGIRNHSPVWGGHGIRILPGPSSLWLDATGRRLPAPLFPGSDSLGTLEHIVATGHAHSWFVLTQRVIEKEFALSGSEQNPDLTGRDLRLLAKRVAPGAPGPVAAFQSRGADFVIADTLDQLLAGMQQRSPEVTIDTDAVRRAIDDRDGEVDDSPASGSQGSGVRRARKYLGDRLIRVAPPHRILDAGAGPLIAVKLHILTRKSLGGIQTDLSGRVLDGHGAPIPGLYAAGEAAGFGGGGMHGYRSLEGTFLGGCLFSGRQAGRGLLADLG